MLELTAKSTGTSKNCSGSSKATFSLPYLSLPIEIYIVSGVAVPVPAKLPIQLDHIEVIEWVEIKDKVAISKRLCVKERQVFDFWVNKSLDLLNCRCSEAGEACQVNTAQWRSEEVKDE